MKHPSVLAAAGLLCALTTPGFAQYKLVNPQVGKIVSQISADRIAETQKKLEGFGTRMLLSTQDDPVRGIGAARKWIYAQFQSYSPRLEVGYDVHKVKKMEGAASRIPRDTDLYNVIAVLPGTTNREERVLIGGHYDSIVLGKPGGGEPEPGEIVPLRDPELDAPGSTDDASGTAAVLELARVLSQYTFEKTLVFITFAGEEEGLVGSNLYAAKAKEEGQKIEALLNNDIIGFDTSLGGRTESHRVSVYSEDPQDSPSRQIARYVRDMAERYVPWMHADPVFRADRFGRGGDHTPFNLEGFAAVRITTPQENLANEHSITDTFANTVPVYTARVAQVNAAAAASLAWAPKTPETTKEVDRNGRKTTQLLLDRGKGRIDAHLSWINANPEPDLAGYVVVWRSTTAPFWEHEVFVGNVTEYTLPGVSIDDLVFGVKAIDKEGNESLVAAYVPGPRVKRTIETY